jgi:hypothetical protein
MSNLNASTEQTANRLDSPPPALQGPCTPEEWRRFRYLLQCQGKTNRQFAAEHGLDYMSLNRTLRGYNKGAFGQSFHALNAIRHFILIPSQTGQIQS